MAQIKQRKVALMGFRSVGKSSLAIQFVQVSLGFLAQCAVKLLLHKRIENYLKQFKTIYISKGQFVDSYDPTIEETFNKNIKIRNQVNIMLIE